jgi:hypothetical protein
MFDDIPTPDALAGDEFGEAWQPAGGRVEDGEFVGGGGAGYADHTEEGAREDAEHREQLMAAETEEERQALQRSKRSYQLLLRFTGAEAKEVRAVMGDQPAQVILRWCREELGLADPEIGRPPLGGVA